MISIISAISKNNVIGLNNTLPWHLPEDLKHFKNLTTGKTVVMGRKTFESIGKPLPNRTNIVLSRNNKEINIPGVITTNNIESLIHSENEIFIIGGSEIYSLFLPYANKLYLTLIDEEYEGDTYFPDIDYEKWDMIKSEDHTSNNNIKFSFKEFVKN